jgi:hypothetical protein
MLVPSYKGTRSVALRNLGEGEPVPPNEVRGMSIANREVPPRVLSFSYIDIPILNCKGKDVPIPSALSFEYFFVQVCLYNVLSRILET